MPGSLGPLVAADEFFHHQVVETHASVGSTDPSWTEKVCGAGQMSGPAVAPSGSDHLTAVGIPASPE